jgi:benzoyl-CoA-dihydrodiol lyase
MPAEALGAIAADEAGDVPRRVEFRTDPSRYRHWKLTIDAPVATLAMDVDEMGGLRTGYELKLNSYDLGVDLELYDAVQRLRFEHPEVRAVVITSAKERIFCAGANIKMLASADHAEKVNFCKFTNENRNAIEDATECSGQTYLAALNGTASGGGYELALACHHIMLVDDRSSVVSLPEVPLLGVLPGTGGLTRLTDKRRVRRDLADCFATRPEGMGGRKAVSWRLVDEVVPRPIWDEVVAERAAALSARSTRPVDASGLTLSPLPKTRTDDEIGYRHVRAHLDHDRRVADIIVCGPAEGAPSGVAGIERLGDEFWPLALARQLDDLVLDLRTNEAELGTWTLRTEGDVALVLDADRLLLANRDHWLVNEVIAYWKRVLKRLDVTSRSLIALVEPASCFAGSLLELALAADRCYMLDGIRSEGGHEKAPACIAVGGMNLGPLPMSNGKTRLQTRFYSDAEALATAEEHLDVELLAQDAERLGLVTLAIDSIDWEDEIRVTLEERSSFSPDALSGMEASTRFAGPETIETKIFGRLSAWQNWVFSRPNAAGPQGALKRYGTGQRAEFDPGRV